jgi:hypothetical protein
MTRFVDVSNDSNPALSNHRLLIAFYRDQPAIAPRR